MEPQIKIFGVEELDQFFLNMKRADQRRLIMDSFRIGAKPLIQASRDKLKSKLKTKTKTNNLYKSLGFVPGKSRGQSVYVSAKIGARKFGNYRGFHGHLYDAGTQERTTGAGKKRGKMPSSGFFTDALAQTENQMINESQDNILKALDKLIQRNLKKQAKAAT